MAGRTLEGTGGGGRGGGVIVGGRVAFSVAPRRPPGGGSGAGGVTLPSHARVRAAPCGVSRRALRARRRVDRRFRRALGARRLGSGPGDRPLYGRRRPHRRRSAGRSQVLTNGRLVVGLPVRASRALATAGPITGVPGSPTPVGWA